MPKRRFNRATLRARRRGLNLSGKELAQRLGVSQPVVAKWEKGDNTPFYDRLPAIARALEADLDLLFPRVGAPDLSDLRCDAEMTLADAAAAIGTSVTPVSKAEKGRQPLKSEHVDALATAYKVSREQLLAAQDRSFGADPVSAAGASTQPFGARVDRALAAAFVDRPVPDDAELTRLVNQVAGRDLLAPGVLAALRAGGIAVESAFPSPADSAAFREALATVLGVPPVALLSDQAVAQTVVEGLLALAGRDQLALAARGAEAHGVAPDMLATLLDAIKADQVNPGG